MIILKIQVKCSSLRIQVAAQQHPTHSLWLSLLACIIQMAVTSLPKQRNSLRFPLKFVLNGRLPHCSTSAHSEELPNQKPLLLCGQFPLPGEKWAEECIEGQSSISKRKTKIMIALTCSWGAVCSLKSSREKVIQWSLVLHSANMLEGEQHTQNKYEAKSALSEAHMLAAMLTNMFGNMQGNMYVVWLLLTVLFLIYCHWFWHFLMVYFCLGALPFFLRFNLVSYSALWHFHLNKSVMLFSITDCHNNSESTWKEFMKALRFIFTNTWCPVGKLESLDTYHAITYRSWWCPEL